MYKKILYGLSVLFFSLILFFIMLKISPLRIIPYSTQAASNFSYDYKRRLEKIYDTNFILSKAAAGNITTFIPSFSHTEYEEAEKISELFISSSKRGENDECFYFENLSESIAISKYGNRIVYESKANTLNTGELSDEVSETQAADICAQFIMSKFDGFIYEEVEIVFDGGIYEITFINRLDNLKNFAFRTNAIVSIYGDIIRLEHFFVSYEKLSSTKIKSMEEAYYELPIDLATDNDYSVDLKKCSLVYYYQSSIVQPAYMFEGEVSGGKSFKCFINASLYGY